MRNLATAFYLDERCRRWATNNPRELAQTEDKVLPFLTRSYVTSVLSVDPDDRAYHQVHRQVIRRLVPELEHEPAPDIPWAKPPQPVGWARSMYNVVMASLPHAARRGIVIARDRLHSTRVVRAPWSPYDEASWLEANLPHARETILSRTSSPLWDYLHRRTVERLLAPGTSADERRLHQLPLFAAYTMFLYEGIEEELGPPPSVREAVAQPG